MGTSSLIFLIIGDTTYCLPSDLRLFRGNYFMFIYYCVLLVITQRLLLATPLL